MTPPARPGVPAPRGGPARPAPPRPPVPRPTPPRPVPPRPDAAPRPDDAANADDAANPGDAARHDGDAARRGRGGAPAARTASSGADAAVPTDRGTLPDEAAPDPAPPSATSDAVTTYTAGRRALGLPVRSVVSTGSAARFAEKAAMRRRLARHRAYLAGAVVALVGALAWLLLLSPVLALDADSVQVTGAGTVVDVADVHAVVAAVDGVPLPRLDTVGLRDRVLDVPGVRRAKISRVWPHGLTVSLVSREPVAAVPQPASTDGAEARTGGAEAPTGGAEPPVPGFTLLDTEGFSVGWTATAPEGLPVVSVPVGEGAQRTLTAVLTILHALPPELAAEVATIEAATQDTVRMRLRDGKTVVWGSAGDAPLKIRVLQALRAAPAAAGAQEFDVSAPTLPITR